jgi:hypothetical protein
MCMGSCSTERAGWYNRSGRPPFIRSRSSAWNEWALPGLPWKALPLDQSKKIVSQLESLRRGSGSYPGRFTPQQPISNPVSGQPPVGLILHHIAKFDDLLAKTTIP